MQALISVIIPVYNIEEYLPICLDSVCNQSYHNLEIIIINDGSSDKSASVCEEYAKEDLRICVIHKQNEGQSVARNMAIKLAKGEYITFIDGDDWIRRDYIEQLYNIAVKYNSEIVNCNYCRTVKLAYVDENYGTMKEMIFDSEHAIENLCYLKELHCAPYCKLFKKKIWDRIEFPIGCIYEDLATIYKTFDVANKIVYVDYNGYFYFQRLGSSLNCEFTEKKLSRITFSKEIVEFIKLNYPNIINASYCRLFWSLSGGLMDIPPNYDNKIWEKKIIILLKSIRKDVLCDRKCKTLIRCMALASFGGGKNYKKLLYLYYFFKNNAMKKASGYIT